MFMSGFTLSILNQFKVVRTTCFCYIIPLDWKNNESMKSDCRQKVVPNTQKNLLN